MNYRWPESNATPATVVLLAVILAGAAAAGMMTALVGSLAGPRAIYYAAIFGLILAGALVALTRREPLRFVFFALILCFPIASAEVPPGRFELSVFDVVAVLLAVGLLASRMTAPPEARAPLFPSTSLLIAWLLAVPCVVFAQFPLFSLKIFVLSLGVYAFFLLTLDELKRRGGFERLVGVLALVLIVLALGCFAERLLHVNLSLRGTNLNQLSYVDVNFEIYRAGGFFQDPQKAATFFGCTVAFLLVLAVRGRFRGSGLNLLAWTAIVLGLGGLILTVSRAAIAACLVMSLLALFLFNRWSAASKIAVATGALLAVTVMALTPELWMDLLPTAVRARFQDPAGDMAIRVKIWFDTWNMFADHPLTGVGFGAFRDYLKATQPTMFNYYGMGDAAGVAYIPDNPESGYFKILYEGGILGSLAVLVATLGAVTRALGVIFSGRDADARTEVIAALVALMVFGVTFVTLFTTSDGRIAGLLAFLFAVIWHRSLQRARPAPAVRTAPWNKR